MKKNQVCIHAQKHMLIIMQNVHGLIQGLLYVVKIVHVDYYVFIRRLQAHTDTDRQQV